MEIKLIPGTILTYEREEEHAYILSNSSEALLVVSKNRALPESFRQARPRPLSPSFRLLALALLGLAPAGLGTLVLAPLAMLWTILVCLTRPLDKADRIRAAIIMGVSAILLGLAFPLGLLFLRSLG